MALKGKMNKHFILDMETIGQDIFTIPLVNCAYYIFDWDRFTPDNPYTFEELVFMIRQDKFDLSSQFEFGYKPKDRDWEWWLDQGKEAKKQLKPSTDDISIEKFTNNILDYIGDTKINYWWSRSNTFDPVLLARCFRDHNDRAKMDKALPFWSIRDIRTFIDANFDFNLKYNNFIPEDDAAAWNAKFVKHNSCHDIAADVLRLQKIVILLNDA